MKLLIEFKKIKSKTCRGCAFKVLKKCPIDSCKESDYKYVMKRVVKDVIKKNLSDIVDTSVEAAFEIIDFRAKLAMGKFGELPENYIQFDVDEQNRILAIVTPLLASHQNTRKLKAETSKDIIKMVKSGKVSIAEATNLMILTKSNLEVQEKELKVKLQEKMIDMIG